MPPGQEPGGPEEDWQTKLVNGIAMASVGKHLHTQTFIDMDFKIFRLNVIKKVGEVVYSFLLFGIWLKGFLGKFRHSGNVGCGLWGWIPAYFA